MGILKALERRSHPSAPSPETIGFFGGRPSVTGVTVTPETALNVSGVWRAVSLITKSLAAIPLNVYGILPSGGHAINRQHALFDLLHNAPNDWQTSYEWREMMVGHLELRGNAYSEILVGGNGKITALIPLHPDRITPYYKAIVPGGPKVRFYFYAPADGPSRVLFWDEILHWRGFSLDGISGLGRIAMARETIGVALAAEEHGARFFANDATPGGVLQHPKVLSEEAQKRLKKSWKEKQQGLQNAHEVQVLEEGMTWQSVGVDNKDAQFLETRKFQIDEIARWFDIPPHKLMEMDRATFSNIEEQNIEFVSDAVIPRTVNIAQACQRDLMSADDRKKHYISFVVKGLVMGNMKSRFESWAIAKNGGFMSANDIRDEEGWNPTTDGAGNTYFVPLNMIPADMAGTLATAKPDPAPADPKPAPSARSIHAEEFRGRLARAQLHPLTDASTRALSREVNAGRRVVQAARSAGGLASIATFADEFYVDHEALVHRCLQPAIRGSIEVLSVACCDEFNASPLADELLDALALRLTRAIAKEHVAESRDTLRDELKHGTLAEIDACFTDWATVRAARDASRHLNIIIAAITGEVARSLVTLPEIPNAA